MALYHVRECEKESTIKDARRAAGLTQKQMCDALGMPLRTLVSWETGNRKPAGWVERLILAELKRIGNNNN